MPRTGENIYERKDGRFEGRYITHYEENGKAKYASVYGHSKAEVREKLREKKNETGSVSFDRGKTVREVAKDWLVSKKDKVAPTTYTRYEAALERNIYPEYGNTPIGDITAAEIESYAKRVAENNTKSGKGASLSTLQMTSGVLSMLVDFERGEPEKHSLLSIADKREVSEALEAAEVEKICAAAKYNETAEMLAVLLTLYCGIRPGESCALDWKDVSLDRKQIFVHQSVHRIKAEKDSDSKTEMRVGEIPTKAHIRTVDVPEEIVEYMRRFYKEGCFVLSGMPGAPMETRTLQKRVERIFEGYKLKNVNFQRLRKTWLECRADPEILSAVFLGKRREKPYVRSLDKVWLTDEMALDVQSLRILIGLSVEEMSEILGLSRGSYYQIESRRRDLSWGEYMTLLFLFRYNPRTEPVLESLGLYPEALKEKLMIR